MTLLLLALLGCGPAAPTPEAPPAPPTAAPADPDVGPLPTDALYQLHPPLTDAHGRQVGLDVHRGHPVVVSMFYASCKSACPRLIDDVRALEAALPDDQRADLRVLLVSLDPARDTPEALAGVVRERGLDDARWTLARTEPEHVRAISAALGIRYRPTGDGEMNHSSILTLLDVEGRPIARLEGLGRDAGPLREAMQRAR